MKENTQEILNERLITGVEIMHKTGIKVAINIYSRVINWTFFYRLLFTRIGGEVDVY